MSQSKRDKYLLRKYGISQAEYLAILAEQRGVCGICFRPPKNVALNVDHDHKLKGADSVRGLLCAGRMGCNRKLGRIDDVAWLRAAIAYLSDHPAMYILDK